ncbi:MAG TPA: DUF664 domain-containing protein [Acidimicrobiales bacterium]|nr:DUF664 domain-containing protein [Acidimicrobiales bacterium]
MITTEDFQWYVEAAVDAMVAIVTGLGDDLANTRPDLPGANSPYAILFHCLGVMEYWGGEAIAGRPVERDRDAEFRAAGPVAELADRALAAPRRLAADLASLDPAAPPRARLDPEDLTTPLRTQGGVALHIYEELARHLGQMELTRDVLRASAAGAWPPGAST